MAKLIAFYLPQFHEIEENNLWWGKGFTEWVNVKKTHPCYKGHRQPRVPLNDNYYDLSDASVQEWQSELALKYGIGGFCYYHYWFGGKMLLQTPMENMLKNPNIKIPFCISWANEPWTRSWDGSTRKILIDQIYGNEENWKQHFEYLLPFFLDNRYIRVDNKPVFLLYRFSNIENGGKMMKYFQKLAKENGLDGLHIVSTLHGRMLTGYDGPQIDAFAQFEPMYTLIHCYPFFARVLRFFKRNILGGLLLKMNIYSPLLRNVNYESIYKKIEAGMGYKTDKPIYNGIFTGWDNTPRRGMRGLVLDNDSTEKFQRHLDIALDTAIKNKSEFLFINAWNEWAEGAYLEPDTDNEYGYLEAIKTQLMQRGLFTEEN